MKFEGDTYKAVSTVFIAALKAGRVPWRSNDPLPLHLTMVKGKFAVDYFPPLSSLILAEAARVDGFKSPFWMTFAQARAMGGHVRAGEHGTHLVYAKGEDFDDDERPNLRLWSWFNLDQVTGIKAPKAIKPERRGFEEIVADYDGPALITAGVDAPSFRPKVDKIGMPRKTKGTEVALLHEIVHSTGIPKRLDRPEMPDAAHFSAHEYTAEELVAEIGTYQLAGMAGLALPEADDAANWARALRRDNVMLVQAGARAGQAVRYILQGEGD